MGTEPGRTAIVELSCIQENGAVVRGPKFDAHARRAARPVGSPALFGSWRQWVELTPVVEPDFILTQVLGIRIEARTLAVNENADVPVYES